MDTILITGKTGLFSKEVLQYTGEAAQIFLTGCKSGKEMKGLSDRVRQFPVSPEDSDFRKVFELGDIRAVWHIARSADGRPSSEERKEIEQILHLCSHYGVSRMIILTENKDRDGCRKMIDRWSSPAEGTCPVQIAFVRLPFLTGNEEKGGRLNRLFGALRRNDPICFEGNRGLEISALAARELYALLLRMSLETWFKAGVYAADGETCTLEELRAVLLSIRPDASIGFSEETGKTERRTLHMRFPETDTEDCDGQLGEIYRLPVSADWRAEITGQYTALVERSANISPLRERLNIFLQGSGKLAVMLLDLFVVFVVAEYLARITSDSVYFKFVDVRLIFVVLMGSLHGIAGGFAAAGLECLMLVLRYREIGISGLLLFYNVENWIPFVYYLTAGAITGYGHQKKEQEVRSVKAENELIRNKYLFLNEAYLTSVANRKDLWAQILNEEDSYSRVYGAMRSMSQRTPEAVCVEAVKTLRDLLDNNTVCIYQLDPGGKNALLLSCCLENAVRKSIDAAGCREMFRTVQSGGIWKNIHFLENAPMYAAQVKFSRAPRHNPGNVSEVTYLVTVDQAGQDQLSLWYMNHFTILCGMFQDALENASLRERTLS